MAFRRALAPIVGAATAACMGEAPQQVAAPTPPVAACLAPSDARLANAMRDDLDGDGKRDWIIEDRYGVTLFVDRAQYVYAWSRDGYTMRKRERDIIVGSPA